MNSRIKLIIFIALIGISIYSVNGLKQTIVTGDNVTVEYTPITGLLTFNKSTVSFVVGKNEVIKGLEIGVIGMKLGEEKNLSIPPSMAFGDYDFNQIYELPNEFFTKQGFSIPSVGTILSLNGKDGIIVELLNESVIINTNNPLAGETVNMTVKVISINNH